MSETKAMKCPDCQGEMQSGFVRFGHGGGLGVSFHKEKPSFWSGRMAPKLIDAWVFSAVRVAYICRNCKLLLFYYEHGEKSKTCEIDCSA